MIEVVGSCPEISKDFPHFFFYLLFFKHTCKLEFTGFMIESCLITKHCCSHIS